jgi:hypothetical protein
MHPPWPSLAAPSFRPSLSRALPLAVSLLCPGPPWLLPHALPLTCPLSLAPPSRAPSHTPLLAPPFRTLPCWLPPLPLPHWLLLSCALPSHALLLHALPLVLPLSRPPSLPPCSPSPTLTRLLSLPGPHLLALPGPLSLPLPPFMRPPPLPPPLASSPVSLLSHTHCLVHPPWPSLSRPPRPSLATPTVTVCRTDSNY